MEPWIDEWEEQRKRELQDQILKYRAENKALHLRILGVYELTRLLQDRSEVTEVLQEKKKRLEVAAVRLENWHLSTSQQNLEALMKENSELKKTLNIVTKNGAAGYLDAGKQQAGYGQRKHERKRSFPGEDEVVELTKRKKPAAHSWDEQLDMLKDKGAESLHRIEAMLKMPGKIAGRLKKKIVSEFADLRKALVVGFTQVKEAIQSVLTSRASGTSSSGHAAIQKHFDELWGAVSRLGMLELTTKTYSRGLITAEVKDAVFSANGVSSGVKADTLLSAIQERIKTDPTAFDAFVEILGSEPPYQHLAEKLKSELLR